MVRRPLIIANWKMNTNLSDAIVLTTSVKNNIADLDVEVVLCPPFVWLYPMAEILEKSPKNIHLGAQNMWFTEKGTMTGEISPLMIKTLAKYVILGHSERRQNFHESDELINDKIKSSLTHNLTPIFCIGELKKTMTSKGRGRPTAIDVRSDIIQQLRGGLEGVREDDAEKIVICYEPVWAISRGTAESRNAADGAYVNETIGRLRKEIARKYGQNVAERITIIYGGSVDEDNIREFIYQPEIDGVLISGASLNAKEFIKICREASGRE